MQVRQHPVALRLLCSANRMQELVYNLRFACKESSFSSAYQHSQQSTKTQPVQKKSQDQDLAQKNM